MDVFFRVIAIFIEVLIPIDKVAVKGKANEIDLYEVYLDKEGEDKQIKLFNSYEKAFNHYEKGHFKQALKGFQHCLSIVEDDKARQYF